MIEFVRNLRNRAVTFEREAHDIFGKHEGAKSRVFSLVATWKQLRGLSLAQNDLFDEALRAIERGLYRSAHVMAWAGFMDFLEDKLASDGLNKVHSHYPAWSKHKGVEDLRENIPEHQLIDAARTVNLLNKPEAKALHGLLSKRNECAHPSSYGPGLNESLGYVAELLNRLTAIDSRPL